MKLLLQTVGFLNNLASGVVARYTYCYLLVLLPLVQLPATTVIPPSFDELVAEADVIFEGRVVKIESKWTGKDETRRIETYYSFQVTDALKGSVHSPYVLQVLGGTVGEDTLEVEGAPNFALGEESLLFVTQNGTQFIPLVRIMHGHYLFKKDADDEQAQVVKHDGTVLRDVESIGKEDASTGGRLGQMRAQQAQGAAEALTPEAFKENVRSKVNEQNR